MTTNELAALGYVTAGIVLILQTTLLLSGWKDRARSIAFAGATGASAIWGVWLALQYTGFLTLPAVTVIVEWLRYVVWLSALTALLRVIGKSLLLSRLVSIYGLALLLVAALPVAYFATRSGGTVVADIEVGVGYVMCVSLVAMIEQIFRNASAELRTRLGYLCVAVAGMFLYDLLLFVATIAGFAVDEKYWLARGFVNAIFAAILFVGIGRAFHLSFDPQVPRQIVIYAFGLAVIAITVVLAIAGHYYVQSFAGTWGGVAGVVFVVAVILMTAVLLVSLSTRRRLRVFLTKAFLQYKYDYRKEWLRFIATLSGSEVEDVPSTAVHAVGQIVNSPGGIVWVQEQEGNAYVPIGSWQCEIPTMSPISSDSDLVRFLNDRQWVIDFEEKQRDPERYDGLDLDSCFPDSHGWWLVVPLYLGSRLFGFVCLKRPRVVHSLNFEDHDLLRTVGRHVGMHIHQVESDKRLAESRQFSAYNRLTAFLMHDLNNLIAQQSLVVQNAERFRQNPKFVDDAMDTIAHSVARMRRLMEQLRRGSKTHEARQTDLRMALGNAVERCKILQPVPSLDIGDTPILIRADPEHLTTVFEHLIRNAQSATNEDGRVSVSVTADDGMATVSIADSGEGMSPEFIRERLFRPFDSTKGSGSMGIGAYQARDYVRTVGGRLEVASAVGVGTEFSIRLRLCD